MAGHSKWANIQHRKGAQDKKRAAQFSKLAKEITVAAKLGGGDPEMNPRLRLAMMTARKQSMPKNNIENAIKKGVGGGEGTDFSEMRYEGYGPAGIAVIVDALTDNKNRTAGDVRAIFTKFGGNLGETGSVNFMFDRRGQVVYKSDVSDADTMFEAALEAGAMDVQSDDEIHDIICDADDFAAVQKTLEDRFGEPEKSGLIWLPNVTTELDEEAAQAVMKLIDALEDNDDVQLVTANFEVSDEVMEKLAANG